LQFRIAIFFFMKPLRNTCCAICDFIECFRYWKCVSEFSALDIRSLEGLILLNSCGFLTSILGTWPISGLFVQKGEVFLSQSPYY